MMTAKFIPGEGEIFKGFIPAVRKLLHVSFGVSSANPDVAVGETGVYNLVDVTVPIVVFALYTQTEEAFTASVTATIGDTGGADRYIADTTINPAASGAVLIAATGLSVPYVDPLGLNIDVTIGGATVAAGLTHVYVEYAELHD
jgi:hypothetical protein